MTAEFPVMEALVTVWFALTVIVFVFAAVPVKERLVMELLDPLIVTLPTFVKLTVPYVWPPPANTADALVRLIVVLPATRLVAPPETSHPSAPLNVMVEEPNSSEPLEFTVLKLPAVMELFPVSKYVPSRISNFPVPQENEPVIE